MNRQYPFPSVDLSPVLPDWDGIGRRGYQEQYYKPEEHGDPLNYPDAFHEIMGYEESSLIHHMSEEDWLNWRENPLFDESWAQLSDFQHVMYDTKENQLMYPQGYRLQAAWCLKYPEQV